VKKNKGIFFDRDGTLIEHVPYLAKPDDVLLRPRTANAIRCALDAGYLLFLFTNQSGVGRGYFTLEDVRKTNARMIDLFGIGPDVFTQTCIPTERPDEPSRYRKPSPAFILEMVDAYNLDKAQSWMVGDAPSDWQAGINAGINVAAISNEPTDYELPTYPDLFAFITQTKTEAQNFQT
jgi:D-glycero-D-manno-heptose 1,7-bisphosphate phosphatase